MRHFRLHVIVRVLVIGLVSLILAHVLINTNWFFTPLVLAAILLLSVISLIFYVERTSRNLGQFLLNISQGGFTTMLKENASKNDLNAIYNDILTQFQKVTIEKESHYQYLQTLNENLGVGLISFDSEGKIAHINTAAKGMLRKPVIYLKDLARVNEDIYKAIVSLQSNERRVVKVVLDHQVNHLTFDAKDFIIQDKSYRLILLQNIHNELEGKELEAWQNLVSVLTHEIMNSVTPISSLSEALNAQVKSQGLNIEPHDQEDFKKSLDTIALRSKGLMKFVMAYKDFSRKPELNRSEVNISKLINGVLLLLNLEITEGEVEVTIKNSLKNHHAKIDRDLFEQVIINLCKNVIDVLKDRAKPRISIIIQKDVKKVKLQIMDNGPGISAEHLDKIFIPFFTTKDKGTGVGLSFARNVLKLHGGRISVNSSDKGTCFTLTF